MVVSALEKGGGSQVQSRGYSHVIVFWARCSRTELYNLCDRIDAT